jgi:Lon protease-like protein
MDDDRGKTDGTDFRNIPLFPLPNVVLFPRCVLPLHIFEERYKAMTADALIGNRQIAMALLQAGWEKAYYKTPPIERVVCIGTIVSHERLADGKFNFLLQGHTRAKVIVETNRPTYTEYRLADLEPLAEVPVMEIDLLNDRQRLMALLAEPTFARLALIRQFQQMLTSAVPTKDIADLIAFNLVDNVQMKQALLAEPDPRRRVEAVISAVESIRPMFAKPAKESTFDPSLN